MTLTPFLLSFTTPQGGTSQPQTMTLSNHDVAPLPVSSIAITGRGAVAFTQTNNCGTSLAAMSSCQITVVSNPQIVPASGTTTVPPDVLLAAVTVTDAAGNSPQTSQLIGVGTLPAVSSSLFPPDNEAIHIMDTVSLVPSTPLSISEVIHVSDNMPATVASTLLPIFEVIHVSDNMPATVASTLLPIFEVIHVSDNMPADGRFHAAANLRDHSRNRYG